MRVRESMLTVFFFSSRRRHTRSDRDWSSDVCSSDLPQWRDLVARYEIVAAQAKPDWGESAEQVGLRTQVETVARQINDYLVELGQIGCVFKGFEEGLVDFYGKLDGKEIFWCWKRGEDRLEHWHELEAGYAGRQPIPEVVQSK